MFGKGLYNQWVVLIFIQLTDIAPSAKTGIGAVTVLNIFIDFDETIIEAFAVSGVC